MTTSLATTPRPAVAVVDTASIEYLAVSWARSLKAEGKAIRTLERYGESVRLLLGFLRAQGMPTRAAQVKREHIEAYIAHELATHAPATAQTRFRALKVFFSWLLAEDEIKANPMANMKPPAVPESLIAILSEEQLVRLLKACDGPSFVAKRDLAMIRLLVDCGLRASEVTNLAVADVSFDDETIRVLGKGSRIRVCPFGSRTARALDRYIRARATNPQAASEALFLGVRGRTTRSGLAQIVEARAKAAGLGHVHPHQLRHSWAHAWLLAGGGEKDLERLAGWRSSEMTRRYAKAGADTRAREAHRRFGLGDRV